MNEYAARLCELKDQLARLMRVKTYSWSDKRNNTDLDKIIEIINEAIEEAVSNLEEFKNKEKKQSLMPLRDEFAKEAMGILLNVALKQRSLICIDLDGIAANSYKISESMMKAREL